MNKLKLTQIKKDFSYLKNFEFKCFEALWKLSKVLTEKEYEHLKNRILKYLPELYYHHDLEDWIRNILHIYNRATRKQDCLFYEDYKRRLKE